MDFKIKISKKKDFGIYVSNMYEPFHFFQQLSNIAKLQYVLNCQLKYFLSSLNTALLEEINIRASIRNPCFVNCISITALLILTNIGSFYHSFTFFYCNLKCTFLKAKIYYFKAIQKAIYLIITFIKSKKEI